MQMMTTDGWKDLRPITWPAIAESCKKLYREYHTQMNYSRGFRKEAPIPLPEQYK